MHGFRKREVDSFRILSTCQWLCLAGYYKLGMSLGNSWPISKQIWQIDKIWVSQGYENPLFLDSYH